MPNQAAVDTFHYTLSPYGQWVFTANYGYCWRPYGITLGWRPYCYGHWVLTDYGWTFVSDDAWGWACYHYGRWYYDAYYGWLWYPGLEWGPAWVAWRTSDAYIGWCPIPPGLAFTDVGFATGGVRMDLVFPSYGFCFVRYGDFCQPEIGGFVFAGNFNVGVIAGTTFFIGLDREHGHVFHRFHDEGRFEGRMEHDFHHPIERFTISDRREPGHSEVAGREIRIFRPDLNRSDSREALRRMAPAHGRGPGAQAPAPQPAQRPRVEAASPKAPRAEQPRAEAPRPEEPRAHAPEALPQRADKPRTETAAASRGKEDRHEAAGSEKSRAESRRAQDTEAGAHGHSEAQGGQAGDSKNQDRSGG